MKKINKNTFSETRALVVGDAMLDRYFFGRVERQSPEANVSVVDIDNIENKLGGAANVALNLVKLNAKVELICCLGKDENGQDLLQELKKNKIKSKRILYSKKRHTTLKGRVYNNDQYLLRLDRESSEDFSKKESQLLLENIKKSLAKFKPDIVILQDYNKGLFTSDNIGEIISLIKQYSVKIVVDPKKFNFTSYTMVDLFKPNLKEISEALKIQINPTKLEELEDACVLLKEKIQCQSCLITLSENGVVCFDSQDKMSHFPAFERDVLDVSGAGDTVISVAALLLANDFSLKEIALYSNLAGGMMIEQKGVVALKLNDFLEEIKKINIFEFI